MRGTGGARGASRCLSPVLCGRDPPRGPPHSPLLCCTEFLSIKIRARPYSQIQRSAAVSRSTPSLVYSFRKIKMGLYPPSGDSIPLVPGTFGPWTNGGRGPFRGCGRGEPGLREPWNPTLLCPGGVFPLCSRGFPLSQLRAAQPRPPVRLHVPPSQIFTYLF